jgi:hypothetical protein
VRGVLIDEAIVLPKASSLKRTAQAQLHASRRSGAKARTMSIPWLMALAPTVMVIPMFLIFGPRALLFWLMSPLMVLFAVLTPTTCLGDSAWPIGLPNLGCDADSDARGSGQGPGSQLVVAAGRASCCRTLR